MKINRWSVAVALLLVLITGWLVWSGRVGNWTPPGRAAYVAECLLEAKSFPLQKHIVRDDNIGVELYRAGAGLFTYQPSIKARVETPADAVAFMTQDDNWNSKALARTALECRVWRDNRRIGGM